MNNPIPAIVLLAASFAGGSVALAQPAPETVSDDVCMVIVYGDDQPSDCGGQEIVVVAVLPEADRYRIPEDLRFSESGDNKAWARRVERFDFVGRSGTLSCSPTGAGGLTGCTDALIEAAYGEKRESSAIRFAQLIEEARAERLATIDASAAEEQARVEAIEKEYMDRLARERDAELPAAGPDSEPLPAPPEG